MNRADSAAIKPLVAMATLTAPLIDAVNMFNCTLRTIRMVRVFLLVRCILTYQIILRGKRVIIIIVSSSLRGSAHVHFGIPNQCHINT